MTINTSRKVALWLIFALISEGMIVKSAIFLENDPTLSHYVLSAGLGAVIFLTCIINKYIKYMINWQSILFLSCLIWSFLSSVKTGYTPNMIAVATFGCMFFFFFVSIPIIVRSVGKDIIRVLYVPFLIMALLSIFLYITDVWPTIDPLSNRFLGSYISVANASIGFSFFTAFSVALLFSSNNHQRKIFFGIMIVLGLYLCFLTKTRSIALETITFVFAIYYGNRISSPRRQGAWFVPTLAIIGFMSAIFVIIVGNFDWSETAVDFRVAEGSLQDSRTGNWAFGIERTLNAPLFGEGMLTKQTQGGTRALDLAGGDNYDSSYDPHSLILSFSVQAGIPFAVGMLVLIFGTIIQYFMIFGLKKSLNNPVFVICLVHTLVMIPTGGDLTSFGNYSDRIYWILLGIIALNSNLEIMRNSNISNYRKKQQYNGLYPVNI
jgi:hypothetical protein